MKKRLLATFLWFYTAWYAGAVIAEVLGISPVLGPILGMAAGALVAVDPRHLIWAATRSADSAVSSARREPA